MDIQKIREDALNYISYETDPVFRAQIQNLLNNENKYNIEELFDRFYTYLSFGTGGLRGIIGGGYNRMNYFVIRRTSEGLARYVCKTQGDNLSAVISYDSRHYSQAFAELSATIFATLGIQVYLYPKLRPTPQLSFTIRRLSASFGIMLTASHNPPEYNGYKVYWNDGSQIVSPHDERILETINAIAEPMSCISLEQAIEEGTVTYLDDTMDQAFLDITRKQSIRRELFNTKPYRVAYTPLHGTGAFVMEPLFADTNIEIQTVAEQREPNGDFPTVKYPNPEEESAMRLALEYAKKENTDLVLATDPDADRLGCAVAKNGSYQLLSGNQHGVLLVDYIFNALVEKSLLPKAPVFVNTIVTTDMQQRVLSELGIECIQTLTGFKNIADIMRNLHAEGKLDNFVMGTEESYGYLIGSHVWDKDAFTAALLTIEMALFFREQGKSILDRLEELYEKYGYFAEKTISFRFEGEDGMQKMKNIMTHLRKNSAKTLGGETVNRILDVSQDIYRIPSDGSIQPGPGLPSSNVLRYEFSPGNWLAVRPSGTEPKLKLYISVSGVASQRDVVNRRAVHLCDAVQKLIASK